jgi:hypothetical protein
MEAGLKRKLLLFLAIPMLVILSPSLLHSEDEITVEELLSRTHELFDAIAASSDVPWKKYFADDCLFFDEKGRTLNKKTIVEEATQLPKGYKLSFKIENPQSRIFRNVAILSYDIVEDLWIFGQKLGANYHATDTWLLRDGTWQITATQLFRYYSDPAPGKADPSRYPEYAGTYELAEGIRADVSVDHDQLYYKREGRPKDPLIPETPDIFFRKGVEGRILFRYGKDGKVDALISRRNREDLIWKKVQ